MLVLDISANNASVTIRWDVIHTTGDKSNINCFIATTDSAAPQDSVPEAFRSMGLAIAALVVVCVLFLLVVAIIVVLGVFYKRMRAISGFSSTPINEKKPLIQK
jgi:hypothetical protein